MTAHAQKAQPCAYDKALEWLVRREYARCELRERLVRRGYAASEVDDALTRLAVERYQDDGRYSEMLVRARVAQGYGPARIRAELASRGVADSVVAYALTQADVDWPALAARQLIRRYGASAASDVAQRAQRSRFLLRRGFAAATVRAAVETLHG